MILDAKPLLELMTRASRCKFKKVFMVNHLLIQCYTVGIDSDIGFHYVLAIPDTEEYSSPFYDSLVELEPSAITKAYSTGHKILLEKKKETGAKPKEIKEELVVQFKDTKMEMKFLYYVMDELVTTAIYTSPYPVDETRPEVENCVDTLVSTANRIKPGGSCVLIDGNRTGIFDRTMDSVQTYFHVIKINGEKVRIPFIRSMFLGSKSYDRFIVSIQETLLKSIYLFSIQLTRKGLTEQFFGYIQNF